MTYLQLVNNVLMRLRESAVPSISSSTYAQLIGKFINDAKRQTEDAYDWNALTATVPIATTPGSSSYLLTGTESRFKVIDVISQKNVLTLQNMPISWLTRQLMMPNKQSGQPMYYGFNGTDATGASYVDLFPVPNTVDTIYFNLIAPQADLSADSDVILIPSEPVELAAYARAIVERGEDGGLGSSEAYALSKSVLADYIAIESSRFVEESCWEAV
jgi:hypothetical protein